MAHYAAGGPPVYPLADGCHDQLISLAIDEAVGRSPICVENVPWADEISILDADQLPAEAPWTSTDAGGSTGNG
jgi:hypothetical protein